MPASRSKGARGSISAEHSLWTLFHVMEKKKKLPHEFNDTVRLSSHKLLGNRVSEWVRGAGKEQANKREILFSRTSLKSFHLLSFSPCTRRRRRRRRRNSSHQDHYVFCFSDVRVIVPVDLHSFPPFPAFSILLPQDWGDNSPAVVASAASAVAHAVNEPGTRRETMGMRTAGSNTNCVCVCAAFSVIHDVHKWAAIWSTSWCLFSGSRKDDDEEAVVLKLMRRGKTRPGPRYDIRIGRKEAKNDLRRGKISQWSAFESHQVKWSNKTVPPKCTECNCMLMLLWRMTF